MNQSIPLGDGAHETDGRGLVHGCSHTVHFYDDDGLFLDSLSEFIGGALGGGAACVVIATEAHRRGLAGRLAAVGIDLDFATGWNRYIALDAEDTLKRFMVAGWPDAERFAHAMEPVLQLARSASRRELQPVVAFGEMVSELYREGLAEAAVHVEKLWNELARRHAFILRCAYPTGLFSSGSGDDRFRRICAEHREIIPADSHLHGAGPEGGWGLGTLQEKATPLQFALELRQKEIEKRRKMEDRLRASEEFARTVIEGSVDWVTVLSLDGRIEYMNPQGTEALEMEDAGVALGREWTEFWDEADRGRAEAELAKARAGKVGSFQAECAPAAGGRKGWDVKITPARGHSGEVDRIIVVSRDISELRQAQATAIRAEKLATAGRMAASIAHEINNPLEAVTNFIYLAQTAPDLPEPVRHQLAQADRELTRVAQIARQTLGFYRSTSVSRWIAVADLIRDALMVYERRLRNKELSAEVEVDPELQVYGKDGELRQALLNLTANAIDACKAGGRIWIRAQRNRNWTNGAEAGIRFTLADNGIGMTAEVKRRLFAPFFTTKADVGTGIGLWVTKCLVEQRGGYVRFRSRQGELSGTVMSFFLPEGHPLGESSALSASPA